MLKVYYGLDNKEWVTNHHYVMTTMIHSVNSPAFVEWVEICQNRKESIPKVVQDGGFLELTGKIENKD